MRTYKTNRKQNRHKLQHYKWLDFEQIAADYKAGLNVAEVAKKHTVSGSHVFNLLRRMDIKMRKGGKSANQQHISKELKKHAIEMYDSGGYTYKTLAELIGVHSVTIHRYLNT